MLWEALVTDGHVRSARLRRLQPWVLTAGLLLIWLGIWIASLAPGVRHDSSVLSILQQRVSKNQMRAEAALTGIPRLTLASKDVEALPPFAEVADVIDASLQLLDKSGALPSETFNLGEIDRNALWKGEWGTERLQFVKAGDLYLVAANINMGTPTRAQPARWIGAFKKFGDKWQYSSLAGPGLYVPPQYPTARPGNIAQSMAPVLPDER